MIFRKPYGFLIKHFKLIHLIMTLFMGILVYQTNLLMEFFNDFVGSSQMFVGNEVVGSLFNSYSYFFAVGIVVVSLIIFILMSFKDKPRFYYVLNIIGYILLIILYAYSVSTISSMQTTLIDERITRAIRDFLNIIFVFQIYSIFISVIRSIGLDLKKFDFSQDAQDLNVTDKDIEEFEVSVEFDSHKLKRKVRRWYRNLKYYFIENKLMLLIVGGLVVFIGGFFGVRSLIMKEKVYKMGQIFTPINYNVSIVESYLTSNDSKGNKITIDDNSLVVVKFKVKTINKTSKFLFGKLALQINDRRFYHTNKYSSKLTDIGTTYFNQNLTNEYQEYLLVYEIPDNLKKQQMNLVYTEQIVNGMFGNKTDDIKITINSTDLDQKENIENINIGHSYIVGSGILSGHEMKVNSYDLQEEFKINYRKCITSDECYQFYEIVKAPLSGISDKGVLKLNIDLKVPNNSKFNVRTLITQFGSIEYEIDGVNKVSPISKVIDTTNNDGNYYFEINKEALNAETLNLVIKIRSNVYVFNLK